MQEIRSSKVLSVGAMCAALAASVLFIACQVPTIRLALIFIASLCTTPLCFEGKTAASVLSYLAAGILSLMLCPQKFPAAAYLLLLGSYAIFKIYCERRIFKRIALLAVKCGFFCLSLVICAILAQMLALIPAKMQIVFQMPYVLAMLPCVIVIWWVLDMAYTSAFAFYHSHIRTYIFPKY